MVQVGLTTSMHCGEETLNYMNNSNIYWTTYVKIKSYLMHIALLNYGTADHNTMLKINEG